METIIITPNQCFWKKKNYTETFFSLLLVLFFCSFSFVNCLIMIGMNATRRKTVHGAHTEPNGNHGGYSIYDGINIELCINEQNLRAFMCVVASFYGFAGIDRNSVFFFFFSSLTHTHADTHVSASQSTPFFLGNEANKYSNKIYIYSIRFYSNRCLNRRKKRSLSVYVIRIACSHSLLTNLTLVLRIIYCFGFVFFFYSWLTKLHARVCVCAYDLKIWFSFRWIHLMKKV